MPLPFAAPLAILSAALATAPAWAEDPPPATARYGTFSLTVENDLFYGRDRHYTNGIRLGWTGAAEAMPVRLRELATALPFFPEHGNLRATFALGQNMFTPEDITRAEPRRDDRPYAGWLYGSAGLVSDTGSRLDHVELSLGVIGPASLAGRTQKLAHRITGSPQPQGWHTQLRNEPAVLLTWARSWRGPPLPRVAGLQLDAGPRVGMALGNVFTHAGGGLMARLGHRLPHDYGPPLIQPSTPGSGFFVPQAGFSWYAFASVEGRAVLRNVFLDGNSFRDSRRVDKEPVVGDLQVGVVVSYGPAQIGYTHVLRSPEFDGQRSIDHFGAVTVSLKF